MNDTLDNFSAIRFLLNVQLNELHFMSRVFTNDTQDNDDTF